MRRANTVKQDPAVRPPSANAAPPRPRRRGWLPPWPLTALVLSFLAPEEMQFYIGGFRLDPPRVVILIAFWPAISHMLNGKPGSLRRVDLLVAGWAAWVGVSVLTHHGAEKGFMFGGSYFVEAFGGYLISRHWIRDRETFGAFARLVTVVVIATLVPNTFECLTGVNVFHETACKIFGGFFVNRAEPRMGLMRAYGPFPHPILNGVFCGSALGFAWFGPGRRYFPWTIKIPLTIGVVVSALTCVSSGAMATLAGQIVLLLWERLTRWFPSRWWLLVTVFAVMYFAVAIFSNRTPMRVLLNYLTFSPETAYGRQYIWEEGIKEIQQVPIIGIGLNSWDHPSYMSDSIDAFWLVVSWCYGLPAGLCLYFAFFNVIGGAVRNARSFDGDRVCAYAWASTTAGIAIAGLTVHFWNATFVYLCTLLGSGVWLGDVKLTPGPKVAPVKRRFR